MPASTLAGVIVYGCVLCAMFAQDSRKGST